MAIATPNVIGGYDHSFVDTPHDRYICKICHLPSRDPYLSECCGHVFCKSCLNHVKKAAAISNACPVCRDKEFVTFRNKQADREIKSLHIYCTNKEKGCEWQGELNDINNHLGNSDGCQFEEVKCSNECGKMIERQYLTGHVETKCPRRKVNCQYCHDTGEHQFIEGQHKEECPKLPLPCPNKCEVGSVPREDMEAHRKECTLEMIQCEYHNVGCEVRMARKDQVIHNKEMVEEHLILTKCRLIKLEGIQDELTATNNRLTATEDQLADALKQINHLTLMVNSVSKQPTSFAQWSITLEVMATMLQSGHQMCPVILKLSEYKKKKKSGVTHPSKPFYSEHKGYKMCLMIDAAGDGDSKGTHLSVFMCLMKGPHDDELTWPLRGKFEIKLLNQISDSEHHSDTATSDNNIPYECRSQVTQGDKSLRARGWGKPKFISNEGLYKTTPTCQYLKDDCLFFQVTKLA